jgi:aminocarboxymuconate-semialdehyde decarboxylase
MRKPAKKRDKRQAGQRARASKRPNRSNAKASKAKSAPPASAKALHHSKGPRGKPVVIDVHAHILVPDVMKVTYGHSQYAHTVAGKGGSGGAPSMPELLLRRMTEAPLRLAQMDETGVDIQVISPSIMQQCTYGLEPEQALELERIGNEAVAEVVARHPDRLVGLGSLPLQDAALATAELERCMRDLDLRGVIVSSHVNGIELGDERLAPFWAKAEELRAVIFIHPAGNSDHRMRRNRLMITIGQPLEEAFALSSLIYEGIVDRFPKLKIMVAHGGGYLPFYAGRHDNDYRYGRSPQLKGDFSSYLPRFFYDTVLFNPIIRSRKSSRWSTSAARRKYRGGIRTPSSAPMRRGYSALPFERGRATACRRDFREDRRRDRGGNS